MVAALGLFVIAAAVFAVVRRVDVRLALTVAALTLGALARRTDVVLLKFLETFSKEQFVVPICTAMGFAYVLRQTGCDRHLVQLLVRPVRRVRALLIPGTVLIGFLVNVPVVSQTSTAVTVGAVLVPLLRAAGLSPVTVGAALLLGSSLGGELLNPGAPELQTVSNALGVEARDCVARMVPPLFVHLGLTTAAFWWLSARAEARYRKQEAARPEASDGEKQEKAEVFRINYFKALVPLVPLVLLFLTGPPWNVFTVPRHWLLGPDDPAKMRTDSRLIGAAMLIGVAVAAATAPRGASASARAFFEGAGYAFTHIISLIVAATCFGEGVKLVGLAALLGDVIGQAPGLLVPFAGALPLAFAVVCGSGFASTQSLFSFFVDPAKGLGIDPVAVGAVVSLASAAGRTMSPVAAVVLMCGSMTGAEPLALTRRVAGPLLIGVAAVVLWRTLALAAGG
jgi:C4-dicarboxylate transporter, DcuC family